MAWVINREEWMNLYQGIVKPTLGRYLNLAADQEATLVLSRILAHKDTWVSFEEVKYSYASYKGSVITGCAPTLLDEIAELKKLEDTHVIIAADGSAAVLMKKGVIPHVIVTDLDGPVHDIYVANRHGTIIVVHAHGDNIPLLEKYVEGFPGKVTGSTQVEPAPRVYNFGGFTDGDRAAFLAYHLGFKEIVLSGFVFGEPYSCPGKLVPFNRAVKKKKLIVAKKLLSYLANKGVVFRDIYGNALNL